MTTTLQVNDICFTYPNNKGIQNISFHLDQGENICLFGKNGSGKSTLFKILSTLIKPQSGDFLIHEKSGVRYKEQIRKYIFTVFDENAHFEFATGKQNIEFFKKLYHVEDTNELKEICDKFDLDLDLNVSEYSFGMKRKLYLIESLISNVDVLFFDEPTLGLDSTSREQFYKLLRSKKSSCIIGTNRIEDVKYADRILQIDQGRLIEINNVDSLISHLITIKIITEKKDFLEYISSIDDLPVLIQNYIKHYRIKGIEIKNQKNEIEWTKEAIEKIERAPRFIRKMIYKLVEDHAKKSNISRITPEIVEEARGRFDH
jgi:ABC-type multidrug transport system ATPase subunit